MQTDPTNDRRVAILACTVIAVVGAVLVGTLVVLAAPPFLIVPAAAMPVGIATVIMRGFWPRGSRR